MEKRVGPKIEPWGTPLVMASGSDRMLSVLEEYSQEELTQIEEEAAVAAAEQTLPVA